MNILGIDTSTTSGSAAILKDEELIAEYTLNVKSKHIERLLPSVDSILQNSGLTLDDIDLFAVTTGPGSFTGLRIGLSAIKGFGWSLNKPVIGVSTLLALSCNIMYSPWKICPVLDARKGEVYTALFRVDKDKIVRETDDMVIKPEGLMERLEGEALFIGNGIKVYGEYIEKCLKAKGVPRFTPHTMWNIRASTVCRLALALFNKGKGKKAEELSVHYIRASEAELKSKGISKMTLTATNKNKKT